MISKDCTVAHGWWEGEKVTAQWRESVNKRCNEVTFLDVKELWDLESDMSWMPWTSQDRLYKATCIASLKQHQTMTSCKWNVLSKSKLVSLLSMDFLNFIFSWTKYPSQSQNFLFLNNFLQKKKSLKNKEHWKSAAFLQILQAIMSPPKLPITHYWQYWFFSKWQFGVRNNFCLLICLGRITISKSTFSAIHMDWKW